jgi:hypothetical protein
MTHRPALAHYLFRLARVDSADLGRPIAERQLLDSIHPITIRLDSDAGRNRREALPSGFPVDREPEAPRLKPIEPAP